MREKVKRLLPWAALAVSYVFTIGVYVLLGRQNLDADIASEMVLADLLNREGGFLSANWYYSTELRVISPVPVYQLALRVFPGNWHMARVLSLAILLVAFAAATIYMGRGAGCAMPSVYAAAAAMLPVSKVSRFLFSGGGFYTAYVIVAFFLIGMVIRLGRGKRRLLRLAAIAVLSLVSGLTGVRMLMIVGLPLCIACALDGWDALREADTFSAALRNERMQMTYGALLSLGAMMAGYVINSRVLVNIYEFRSYETMEMRELDLALLGGQIQYLMNFFGLNEGIPLLSMGGIMDMMTLCVCALMAIAAYQLMKRRALLAPQVRVLVYFAVFAVALGMFLNIITGTTENRYAVGYYMAGAFMLVLLVFLLLDRMRCNLTVVRTLSMLAVFGVFFLQSVAFTRSYMRSSETEYEAAAEWLTENGYTQGFATFWNGNVLTELSDGELDMYIYEEWSGRELTPWLQEKRHIEAVPEGETFVFVSNQETYGPVAPCMREENLVWTSPHGSKVYVYDSAEAVLTLQRTMERR